jgi:hypothetical protein
MSWTKNEVGHGWTSWTSGCGHYCVWEWVADGRASYGLYYRGEYAGTFCTLDGAQRAAAK